MEELNIIKAARSGQWLSQKNAIYICLLVSLVMALGVISTFPASTFDTDFISFYAASIEVINKTPQAAYDQVIHHETQKFLTDCCADKWYAFFYPPVMLLIVWPLALLPFKAAFFAWGGSQLLLFIASLKYLLKRRISIIPFLAFPPIYVSLAMGQNALLTASIFAGATAAINMGRPLLAGLIFGCLIYKPHFGILLPIAFLAGREWKALIGAAISSVGLILLSALAFGTKIWEIYINQASATALNTFAAGDVSFYYLDSPYAASRLLGADDLLARLIQLTCFVFATLLVTLVWSRTKNIPVRSATLIAATMLATPVILFYDLLLTIIVIAWIVLDAKERGWNPWEKTLLSLLFFLAFVAPSAGKLTGLPYGLLCIILTLILAWKRFNYNKTTLNISQ